MNSVFSVVIYILAVVGFIGWVWLRTRAMNKDHDLSAQGDGGADDLTQISGIGQVIAGKLHKLGYTRFEQIAAFTKQDIDRVNQQLNFKGRIEREAWVKQAKKLTK